MNFYSVRDLRTDSKSMWETLSAGNEVVITNNGKPAALMIDIPSDSFDEVVQASCSGCAPGKSHDRI